MTPRVAIIGGGITGLAAARRLQQQSPALDITVFEREGRLGGKIYTEQNNGFVVEAGPDSFLSVKPRGVGLSEELGVRDRLHWPREENRGSFVLRRGQLHPIPEGLSGLIPTKLQPMLQTRLLSWPGKLRMLLDLVRRPKSGLADEPLAGFIERRLGREAYESLVEPLLGGIYAGDGRQLSLLATYPQLRAAEQSHGGLIRGMLAARKDAESASRGNPPRRGFLSFPNGMQELIDALHCELGANGVSIQTGAAVESLSHDGEGYRLTVQHGDETHIETFDGVMLAVPAWEASRLLQEVSPAASEPLGEIPHVSNATVALNYPISAFPKPLKGFGYVSPRAEGRPVMAVTWMSSKWAGRAPEGEVLLRGFIGRAGNEIAAEHDDAGLVALLEQELQSVLNVSGSPTWSRVYRWDRGMPQYALGHRERISRVEGAFFELDRMEIAGNMFRGVGIPDCILSGERAAERLARSLL